MKIFTKCSICTMPLFLFNTSVITLGKEVVGRFFWILNLSEKLRWKIVFFKLNINIGWLSRDKPTSILGIQRGYGKDMLTFCIILIRPVHSIFRAWNIGRPKCSSVLSFPKPGKINMTKHATLLERLGEIRVVDMVIIVHPDQDGKIIMAILNSISVGMNLIDGFVTYLSMGFFGESGSPFDPRLKGRSSTSNSIGMPSP